MATHTNHHSRVALTLVELLVVIAIIAFLAALTALSFPRFQERELVSRAADQLQMWLVMAKQQARRDGLPTGLEFTSSAGDGFFDKIYYVQQPPPTAIGLYLNPKDGVPANASQEAIFDTTLGGPDAPVKAQDYLELYETGEHWRIQSVNGKTLVLEAKTERTGTPIALPSNSTVQTGSSGGTNNANQRTNYRILRQPQRIPGEQEQKFSESVGIDIAKTLELPSSKMILFSPSGEVLRNDGSGKVIVFWLRDKLVTPGYPTLIAIQPRTGFIAAHPVPQSGDPYLFTKDARSSGM